MYAHLYKLELILVSTRSIILMANGHDCLWEEKSIYYEIKKEKNFLF